MKINNYKRLLIIPVIVIGVGIFVYQKKNSSKPVRMPVQERTTAVRFIQVPHGTVFPLIMTTGYVQPGRIWQAVAEVGGKVIFRHPRLKRGALINANEVLLKLDPSDHELAIARAETDIESSRIQLAHVDVQEANAKASLTIERKALKIAQEELQRKQKLLNVGSLSPSDVEKEQRNVLAQEQRVQALVNSINLYPIERRRLKNELMKLETQLATAKLTLERTTIRMPFNGRIAAVNIDLDQFVGQGGVMLAADSIETAEVLVQIPMARLAGLVQSDSVVNTADWNSAEISKLTGLSAKIQIQQNNLLTEWEATVARVGHALDPRTRTVDIIIEVDRPYEQIQPGKRPPLVKGLFVDVKLMGRPRADSMVIPLIAVHNRQVYVITDQNRLKRYAVTLGFRGSDYVIVEAGLDPGDRIVISDLVPAIDGMLLEPIEDAQASAQLLASAAGGTDP